MPRVTAMGDFFRLSIITCACNDGLTARSITVQEARLPDRRCAAVGYGHRNAAFRREYIRLTRGDTWGSALCLMSFASRVERFLSIEMVSRRPGRCPS